MTTKHHDLAGDVREALAGLGIDELHVESADGCMYVHGVAPSYRAKRLAGELAAAAARGACVVNELRVGRNDFSEDVQIQRELRGALAARVPGQLSADVRDGVVRLYGVTDDEGARRLAEELAWDAPGVQHVQNGIMVTGRQRDDAEIAAALNEYIQRALNPGHGGVRVGYREGVASLSGAVASASQAHAIEDLIRWHDGVRDVVNNLQISTGPGVVPIIGN